MEEKGREWKERKDERGRVGSGRRGRMEEKGREWKERKDGREG